MIKILKLIKKQSPCIYHDFLEDCKQVNHLPKEQKLYVQCQVYKNVHPLFLSSLSTHIIDYPKHGVHISKYRSIFLVDLHTNKFSLQMKMNAVNNVTAHPRCGHHIALIYFDYLACFAFQYVIITCESKTPILSQSSS